MMRANTSVLWDYYHRVDPENKRARCNFCSIILSYKSTTANLKTHLRSRHDRAYREVIIKQKLNKSGGSFTVNKATTRPRQVQIPTLQNVSGDDSNDSATNVTATSQLREQFRQLDSGHFSCLICDEQESNNPEALRKHLLEKHPDSFKAEEDVSDAEDRGEIFTETVYLEDESPTPISPRRNYPTQRRKSMFKPRPVKKEHRLSSSSDEVLLTKKKLPSPTPGKQENEELESFLSYIRVLLKDVPKDVFQKLQLEIVNTIMSTKLGMNAMNAVIVANENAKRAVLGTNNLVPEVATVSTVTDTANYSITIANPTPAGTKTEDAS